MAALAEGVEPQRPDQFGNLLCWHAARLKIDDKLRSRRRGGVDVLLKELDHIYLGEQLDVVRILGS